MTEPSDEMVHAACEVAMIPKEVMRESLRAALEITEGNWRDQISWRPPVRRRRREAMIDSKIMAQLKRSIERNARLVTVLKAAKTYIENGGDREATINLLWYALVNNDNVRP